MEFSHSIHIDTAPADVWQVVIDVDSWPSMTPSVTAVERLDDGPLRLGSRVRITQPKIGTAEWTVTEVVPGQSFTWASSKGGVRTVATHTITPDGAGTNLELTIAHAGPLAWIAGKLTAATTRRYLTLEAAGFKQRSERTRT